MCNAMLSFEKIRVLLVEYITLEHDSNVSHFVKEHNLNRVIIDNIIHGRQAMYKIKVETLWRILQVARIDVLEVLALTAIDSACGDINNIPQMFRKFLPELIHTASECYKDENQVHAKSKLLYADNILTIILSQR